MDAKETLAKFPLSGSLFLIGLAVAFLICHSHDQIIRAALYDFHAKHLLQIEAPIYDDFYSKRLSIEQIGSETQLDLFRLARQNKQTAMASHLILSDRSFRPYLHENSRLFFTAKEAERWQSYNETLSSRLSQLSQYQLALIPEQFARSPEFSRLASYLFVETHWLNLTSNILLMLCLFILLEPKIRRSTFWTVLFCLSIIHSSLYLLMANPLSPPLEGSNMLLYFLFSLALTKYIQAYIRLRAPLQLYLTLAITLCWLLKFAFDLYYQFIFSEQFVGIGLATITGSVIAWQGYLWRTEPTSSDSEPAHVNRQPSLSADLRKQYNEALTALTRFNFAYARTRLRQLRTEAPESQQILQSSYYLEKLHPDEAYFWSLAEASIEHAVTHQNYTKLLGIFKDIQDCASTPQSGSQNIHPEYYLKMLVIFLQNHNLEKAEHSFRFLALSKNKPILKNACLLLIEHFDRKKFVDKKAHYQALYDSL